MTQSIRREKPLGKAKAYRKAGKAKPINTVRGKAKAEKQLVKTKQNLEKPGNPKA
jgi:hypothetical protein